MSFSKTIVPRAAYTLMRLSIVLIFVSQSILVHGRLQASSPSPGASAAAEASGADVKEAADEFIYFYFPGKEVARDDRLFGALGNFFENRISFKGRTFTNAEAAFQSEKFKDESNKDLMARMCAEEAFKFVRSERPGYLENNVATMFEVLKAKFAELNTAGVLMNTRGKILIEANSKVGRDDIYSNNKNGKGYNLLGMLLMYLRDGDGFRHKALVDILLMTGLWIDRGVPRSTVGDEHGNLLTEEHFKGINGMFEAWKAECVRPSPQ